jgi:hypothetical protein
VTARSRRSFRRHLHFVGTLPQFPDAAAAIAWQRQELGDDIRRWTGGETQERLQWFIPVIQKLKQSAKIRTRRSGTWRNYGDTDRLAVRLLRRLTPEDIPLTTARAFTSEAAFIPDEDRRPLQVSIPGYLDMALFAFGPRGTLRTASAFRRALTEQIRIIRTVGTRAAVFQLELPAETIAVTSAPALLRPLAAKILARLVLRQVREAPAGTHFGFHLCFGDLGHEPLRTAQSAAPMVAFANALARAFPRTHHLDFVHLPVCAGSSPPTTDAAYYEPLRRLRLGTTSLVAGVAHELQSLDEQRLALRHIEHAVGHPVDIATPCGLGRRAPDQARAAVDAMQRLL